MEEAEYLDEIARREQRKLKMGNKKIELHYFFEIVKCSASSPVMCFVSGERVSMLQFRLFYWKMVENQK